MDSARRILAREDDEEERPWTAAPEVDERKISRFEGHKKKSKWERDREAEAERARQEEQDAARAYDDFLATFGGDEEQGPSTSSRPRVGAAPRPPGKGFVKAGGEKYNPLADRPPPPPQPAPSSWPPPAAAGASAGPSIPTGPKAMTQQRPAAASFRGDDDEPDPTTKPTGPPGRKKRAGADFLEQLKRDQAAREERLKQTAGRTGASITALAAREHAPVLTGSYDMGDPLTTNVHVGGLPTNVTEESLGKLFAQFGPVGSVK
ncbi:hypothetical protein JCM10207_002890, partial [Rhodosporidiobolus poonsookiae]